MQIEKISFSDNEYPDHLRNIKNPPEELFFIGNIDLIRFPLVAIVGTRRCSEYGRWAANEIAKQVASCGISVVSGMAEGIDSSAHWGCISKNVPTVAVFGTGVDICFPASNKKLYNCILKDGLILSEYSPGTRAQRWSFPQRNRIISALSKCVVVAEGAPMSGSMITAGLAAEQGRNVFAVPGNINQPCSLGVNKLIYDGAVPILSIESVAETLGIGKTRMQRRIESLSDEEKIVLAVIIDNPGSTVEYIAMKTGFGISETSVKVSALELKSIVSSRGQKYFSQK